MGSVTEDVAATPPQELAAAVAADNEARAPLPPVPSVPAPPETTRSLPFSAALRESESAEPRSALVVVAARTRMALGVRHAADARIPSNFRRRRRRSLWAALPLSVRAFRRRGRGRRTSRRRRRWT